MSAARKRRDSPAAGRPGACFPFPGSEFSGPGARLVWPARHVPRVLGWRPPTGISESPGTGGGGAGGWGQRLGCAVITPQRNGPRRAVRRLQTAGPAHIGHTSRFFGKIKGSSPSAWGPVTRCARRGSGRGGIALLCPETQHQAAWQQQCGLGGGGTAAAANCCFCAA